MSITNTQNKLLHALLAQTNLTPHKEDLVASFTENRTTKSSEMDTYQAQHLITHLKAQLPPVETSGDKERANKLRRKIIALAWQMQWTKTVVYQDGSTRVVCDVARINKWCKQYGYIKKDLNGYTITELPKLITIFEKVYNDYLKAV